MPLSGKRERPADPARELLRNMIRSQVDHCHQVPTLDVNQRELSFLVSDRFIYLQ